MNPVLYSRITNICIVVVMASVFMYDRVGDGWKMLLIICASLAALVSVITYFYNQHLMRKNDDSSQFLVPEAGTIENAEEAIRYVVIENNMTEKEFLEWMYGVWKKIVDEMSQEDDENEDLF